MDDRGFLGTWRLVSFEQHGVGGQVSYPLGEHLVGYLIYTADGYMSVQMMAAGLDVYRAYCGTYDIQQDRVVHHVIVSSWPKRVGTDLVRFFSLDGKLLRLRTAPFLEGNVEQVSYLTWERV